MTIEGKNDVKINEIIDEEIHEKTDENKDSKIDEMVDGKNWWNENELRIFSKLSNSGKFRFIELKFCA